MLSLPKHLGRFVAMPFNEAAKMLRQAQHDVLLRLLRRLAMTDDSLLHSFTHCTFTTRRPVSWRTQRAGFFSSGTMSW